MPVSRRSQTGGFRVPLPNNMEQQLMYIQMQQMLTDDHNANLTALTGYLARNEVYEPCTFGGLYQHFFPTIQLGAVFYEWFLGTPQHPVYIHQYRVIHKEPDVDNKILILRQYINGELIPGHGRRLFVNEGAVQLHSFTDDGQRALMDPTVYMFYGVEPQLAPLTQMAQSMQLVQPAPPSQGGARTQGRDVAPQMSVLESFRETEREINQALRDWENTPLHHYRQLSPTKRQTLLTPYNCKVGDSVYSVKLNPNRGDVVDEVNEYRIAQRVDLNHLRNVYGSAPSFLNGPMFQRKTAVILMQLRRYEGVPRYRRAEDARPYDYEHRLQDQPNGLVALYENAETLPEVYYYTLQNSDAAVDFKTLPIGEVCMTIGHLRMGPHRDIRLIQPNPRPNALPSGPSHVSSRRPTPSGPRKRRPE